MKKNMLIADDDVNFHELLTRVFEGSGWEVTTASDGVTALEKLVDRVPDVILLDLNMPRMNGRDLLAMLRRSARYSMVPVIIISGDASPQEQAAEFGLGADDFVAKPFDMGELRARVEGACRRARRMLAANPLTMLPGGPAIEEEAAARIRTGSPLGFFYIDIDNFKAYNDNYGYLNGDAAIRRAAGVLTSVQEEYAGADVFVGHIGGDDFVLMCDPEKVEEIAGEIARRFDSLAPSLYSQEDAARGCIVSKDRAGARREFPLMSLTMAIATNERRRLDHYAKIVDIASEIKKYLKGRSRPGSAWLKDRRVD